MTSITSKQTKHLTLNSEEQATIYIRNYAKKAIMLVLPTRMSMKELRERIHRKMKVPQEDQALFLRGFLVPNDLEEI